MKRAIFAAVLAVSPAFAQVPIFRTAAVTVNGKELPACWTLRGDEVWIVDADGDSGPLPAVGFRPVKAL